MSTTLRTEHANELIVVDHAFDATGVAVVALGLVNEDGSDTFPGRSLTPDQAEELAAGLAISAAAARASAGRASQPLEGEQAYGDALQAIRKAVRLAGADEASDAGEPSAAPEPAVAPEPSAAPAPSAAAEPVGAGEPSGAEPDVVPSVSADYEPVPADASVTPSPPAQGRPRGPGRRTGGAAGAPAAGAKRAGRGRAAQPSAPEPPPAMPIAGYDDLSAAVITKRLSGLSAAELSAVLAYEQSNRNRKTIRDRIVALQSSSGRG
ncbi:MAG: hypothetical protein ABSG43_01595 [Solirubrobacteraceae bacterium]|jgi:hypothetical protein